MIASYWQHFRYYEDGLWAEPVGEGLEVILEVKGHVIDVISTPSATALDALFEGLEVELYTPTYRMVTSLYGTILGRIL